MKEKDLAEILEGLRAKPKSINSKFFYDSRGSELFRQITRMEEYYLTRAEEEILKNHGKEIFERINTRVAGNGRLDIVELGVGDGRKTIILFDSLMDLPATARFIPVDVSGSELKTLANVMREIYPQLEVEPMETDYFEALNILSKGKSGNPKLALFMGSNIGNFTPEGSFHFLKSLRLSMNPGDYLLIGFDLAKNPETILNAYNDKEGVTREFNINLLRRLNEEFGANFVIKNFVHYPIYDPLEQAAKSYLISLSKQRVKFLPSGDEIYFEKYEPVFTEISQKYSYELISELATRSGFGIIENYTDANEYFLDSLWQAN